METRGENRLHLLVLACFVLVRLFYWARKNPAIQLARLADRSLIGTKLVDGCQPRSSGGFYVAG